MVHGKSQVCCINQSLHGVGLTHIYWQIHLVFILKRYYYFGQRPCSYYEIIHSLV